MKGYRPNTVDGGYSIFSPINKRNLRLFILEMDADSIRKAAGLFGGLGVCIGAFGAHALKDILTSRGTLVCMLLLQATDFYEMKASFQTGYV